MITTNTFRMRGKTFIISISSPKKTDAKSKKVLPGQAAQRAGGRPGPGGPPGGGREVCIMGEHGMAVETIVCPCPGSLEAKPDPSMAARYYTHNHWFLVNIQRETGGSNFVQATTYSTCEGMDTYLCTSSVDLRSF